MLSKSIRNGLFLLLALSVSACAHHSRVSSEDLHGLYRVSSGPASSLRRFAPLLLAHGYGDDHNRIGTPRVKYDTRGSEEIYIDVKKPAIYGMTRKFTTSKGRYTNLVYRVHFPEVPLSLIPFYLTAGKNVGILFIVTLDERNHPVLFTTSGTCGCYAVIIPTSYLDKNAYPKEWHPDEPLAVYGEVLPRLLDFTHFEDPILMVSLRPDVHRVMNVQVVEGKTSGDFASADSSKVVLMSLLPMGSLLKIPAGMGKTTSLFYDTWPYEGLVKGAFKPWETLLMSLISLDFFVGTDKIYGNSDVTGTHFYTSLKPWNRKASDMWHFDRFLRFNGWDL